MPDPEHPRHPVFTVPGLAKRPSGLWAPVDLDARTPVTLPPELRTRPAPLAMVRRPPSWHDHIGVYLTADELGLPPGTMSSIARELSRLPFERTMAALSWLHHAVAYAGTDKERQMWLASQVFQDGELLRRAARFIRAEERPSVVFEQQIMALQRLAILHCAPGAIDAEIGTEEELALISALLSTTGVVVERALPVRPASDRTLSRDDLLRLFLAGTPFAHREWVGGTVVRAHRMFAVIAGSEEARNQKDWCDLEGWLTEAGLPSVRTLLLAGLGLANAASVFENEPVVHPVSPTYLDTLGRDGAAVVRGLTGDREWYHREIAKTQAKAADAARNAIPFYQRPYLRLEDGRLLALGWRAATAVMTEEGVHYRLADLASRFGKRSQYNRFSGWLYERYAVELAEMAHGSHREGEVYVAGRVHSEQRYETGKGSGMTPDVAIDCGLDLILVETTHSRPTTKSLIDTDVGAIERDLEKTIGKKLRQLATAIRAIREGRAILPDLEPTRIRRVWPLLVLPAPVFQNDVMWEYIDRVYPVELRHPMVQSLTLMETADYEWLVGQVAEGIAITTILERKTQDLWRRRDLRSWFNDAPDRVGVEQSSFLGQLFDETIDVLAEPLKPREAA